MCHHLWGWDHKASICQGLWFICCFSQSLFMIVSVFMIADSTHLFLVWQSKGQVSSQLVTNAFSPSMETYLYSAISRKKQSGTHDSDIVSCPGKHHSALPPPQSLHLDYHTWLTTPPHPRIELHWTATISREVNHLLNTHLPFLLSQRPKTTP